MLPSMTCTGVYCVFLQLWLLSGSAADQNVAPRGTASQSSTLSGYDASHALDWNPSTCSQTAGGLIHWWSLRLPAKYRISSVTIYGNQRINNAEILIGNNFENNGNNNPKCAVISGFESSVSGSFSCGGMIGQLVNVYLSGTDPTAYLSLCQVDVFGELAALAPSVSAVVKGRNIAVVKKKLCWSDALFYCRDFYWDLLSIRSEEEQTELKAVLEGDSSLTEHVWVGLRRYLMAGTWFWMSGDSMNYTYRENLSVWQDTSPCGGIRTRDRFQWTDLPCDDHLYFVCLTDSGRDEDRVEYYSSRRPVKQG